MIDAVSEFLSANRQRRYPFDESSSVLDGTGVFEIPNDLILDYRGFHRARPELKARLAAICCSGSGSHANYPAATGKLRFYFEMGPATSPLRLMTEIDENETLDIVELMATAPDPFYPGINLGTVRVTVGSGWKDLIGGTDRWLFEVAAAVLEPALTVESYRLQIDYLRIIHQEGPTEYLSGDVQIFGGHNVTISGKADNTVSFAAELGAGELGRFIGQLRDGGLEFCDGALMFVNGTGPNERGELTFAEGNGIKIVAFPSQHKIQISVSPGSLQRPLCQ